MILDRIGNKKALGISRYFPPKYEVYCEPFFGAGGSFFDHPLAKHNWLNDKDGDVINFWLVVQKRKDELIKIVESLPIHEGLFKYWLANKESEQIMKAVRFLFLSNFSLFGKGDTMLLNHSATGKRDKIAKGIDLISERIKRCCFRCVDFRDFLEGIVADKSHIPVSKRFIYADPPYLGSTSNYNTRKWRAKDLSDLVSILKEYGSPFAISERDTKTVRDIAQGLNVTPVVNRRAINGKCKEILISNYDLPRYRQMSFI